MSKPDAGNDIAQCALCPFEWAERFCRNGKGKAPAGCPSVHHRDLAARALEEIKADPALLAMARESSLQEAAGYGDRDKGYAHVHPIKPRILEIVEFARRLGCKRLGLAFCGGLRAEGGAVHRFFADMGFEVASFMCKAGAVPKSELGIAREDQVDPSGESETMCNPVFQALAANAAQVDLNVLLGLCVGHDSLFIRFADAPVTVLAVKDRMLAHNPLAAVYQMDQYYRFLKSS
jgi:uncharacterized metal-binding protein